MTQDEAKNFLNINKTIAQNGDYLKLIKACAEGKTIQYMSTLYGKWMDCEDGEFCPGDDYEYRIKPTKVTVYVATWIENCDGNSCPFGYRATTDEGVKDLQYKGNARTYLTKRFGRLPGFQINTFEREVTEE